MNMETIQPDKPNISEIAFWDVKFEELDYQDNSLFIMDKVFNYGTWSDILETLKFYGIERVKKEIVQAPYFKSKNLAFLCTILHLDEQDFVSYQRRQERKPIWNE